jgi:two-component system chemotaxis sensor kinase CheA
MNAEKSADRGLDVQEIVISRSGGAAIPQPGGAAKVSTGIEELERCFEKLSAEFVDLPAGNAWQQVVRAGKAAAVATGKEVEFEVRGEDLRLDESIVEALLHLVRNAVDHGIELRGKIVIEAQNLGDKNKITVTDNGRGIDPSMIDRIFDPGFSTATELSEMSGRGVGLDAGKTAVEAAGGSVNVSSRPSHGTTFEITLPHSSDPR